MIELSENHDARMVCHMLSLQSISDMVSICNSISKAATAGGGLRTGRLQVIHQTEQASGQMIGPAPRAVIDRVCGFPLCGGIVSQLSCGALSETF